MTGFFYSNAAGQRLFAAEPPLEPDDWPEEGGDEQEDGPAWVFDEDHSYVVRAGEVLRYD